MAEVESVLRERPVERSIKIKDVLADITYLIDVLTTFKETIVGSANDGEKPNADS